MQLEGNTIISHPRNLVWDSLYDADTIRRSISGCEELEWVSDNQLEGVIRKKFGPVKASFGIVLSVSEVVEYESYTMSGSSQGTSFGYVNGVAEFKLVDVDGGCELCYVADIKLGGKIAQIGSRLMGSASKKIVEEFFEKFSAELANNIESLDE